MRLAMRERGLYEFFNKLLFSDMAASFSGRGETTLTLAVRDTENPVELRGGNVQCHRLMQNNSLRCESNRNNMALCNELISVAILGLVRKRI